MKKIVKIPPPPVSARPKCPGCSKTLRPWMTVAQYSSMRPGHERPTITSWEGQYHRYGAFCTLRCCQWYANEMYKRTRVRFVPKASSG